VYVTVVHDKYLFAAHYAQGLTELMEIGEGGKLKHLQAHDSGRETHCVVMSPDKRFAFVPSKGDDKITIFAFDKDAATFSPQGLAKLPQGSGCRHFVFHPNGQHAYLINEYSNTVVVYAYDAENGVLTETQTISTNPDGINAPPVDG